MGATLYLLLTDRLPYAIEGLTSFSNMKRFDAPLDSPARLNPEVDSHLEEVVFKALAKQPRERYQTASELLAALERRTAQPKKLTKKSLPAGAMESTKAALGDFSPANEAEGKKMAAQALKLVRQRGKISVAADLMEEAFRKWPPLREQYEWQLTLWRRGIVM